MEALTLQQLASEGHAEYNKGEYFSAAGFYKAAADGFSWIGDEFSAAEMSNNSSVAYLKGGETNSALEAVNGTDQVWAIKGDIKCQVMAIGNRVAALEGMNQRGCHHRIQTICKTVQPNW
jgi:hypothetical protein